jgi:pyruvate, orthophosphate dikinase
MSKRVYLFREGDATMRDLLGGKGANLAEMTNIGLPVPPGFTITTEVCTEYYQNGKKLPSGLLDEMKAAMADIEKQMGRSFGGTNKPLLMSVRSGAKFSMPGMMDTVLNLGLNPETLEALIAETGDARFVYDSYRRFIMMFSDVAFGLSKHSFDNHIFSEYKAKVGAATDLDLNADQLKEVCDLFLAHVRNGAGREFPTDVWEQLELSVEAVFSSWNNDRANTYRRKERISDSIGTAVNVQAMVYGNAGDDCGTGVAFTRDPSTGENVLYGEYLMNAQGEDVVAGVRTPVPISELKIQNEPIYNQFVDVCNTLEKHYRDIQDVEFTIQHGVLYMLQCRSGKRTGPAAVKIAVEMVEEGLISPSDAVQRVTASHLDQLLHKQIDRKDLAARGLKASAKGIPASPGAAVGQAVFNAADAVAWAAEGKQVILVREETNPDDVGGMLASQAVLTARGGKTSHAAVVARGFGIPCVAGCEALHVADDHFVMDGNTIQQGDVISLDGSTGEVFIGGVATIEPEITGNFDTLMHWCDESRRLKIRTNADNPNDARQAIEFGAEGIGLCRTEHMFFGSDRLPIVQQMILTKDEVERQAALDKLLVVQQSDFEEIFEVMDGRPVTVRLIDPPMHEFLPSYDELLVETTALKTKIELGVSGLEAELKEKEALLAAVSAMKESNPMLGLRGVRLSIIFPGLVVMQTRAILQAAAKLIKAGKAAQPEIMIPLVGTVNELKVVQTQLEETAKAVVEEQGVEIPYLFGTMIEIPRAALTAAEIAEYAQFFSFGTNDLTQMTFGYSRDDAEGKFLGKYVDSKILPYNVFETIDFAGVGKLMKMAVTDGRATREGLKCGICGEHGGDPDSVVFCHQIGLDYVSCSPFRVPIARLAAAQAALAEKNKVTLDK